MYGVSFRVFFNICSVFRLNESAHNYLQPFIFPLLFVAVILLFVSCFSFRLFLSFLYTFDEIKRQYAFIQIHTYTDDLNIYVYICVSENAVRTRSMLKEEKKNILNVRSGDVVGLRNVFFIYRTEYKLPVRIFLSNARDYSFGALFTYISRRKNEF